MEKPDPERRDCSATSWDEFAAEVDDVFETTEAFWAARRRESSRVRRLTYDEH